MSRTPDVELVLRDYLTDDGGTAPDYILDVVADRIGRQPQRRTWRRRRLGTTQLRVLIAAAALLGAGLATFLAGQALIVRPQPTATPHLPISSSGPGTGLIVFEHAFADGHTRVEYLADDRTAEDAFPDIVGTTEQPAWSADGTTLAFAVDPGGEEKPERIWEAPVAPGSIGAPRLATSACPAPDCLGEIDPAYSRDGRSLAFIRRSGASGTDRTSMILVILDLETGALRVLGATQAYFPGEEIRHPSWSPDGSAIAYNRVTWSDAGPTASSLEVIDADGQNRRAITPAPAMAGDAAWSADGAVVLYSTRPLHSFWGDAASIDVRSMHIYAISPDGTGLRQLNNSEGGVGSASWAPSGDVVFVRIEDPTGNAATSLMEMSPDGSDLRPLAGFSDCCRWYPVQQPGQ